MSKAVQFDSYGGIDVLEVRDVPREGIDRASRGPAKRDTRRGKSVPFWVLDGFGEIRATLLERMAGTTRLELATSAVTGKRMTIPSRPPRTAKCGLKGRNHNKFRAICG